MYKFFTYRIKRKYEDKIKFLTDGFDFILGVINIYLQSHFFNFTQKALLRKFGSKIKDQKLKINQQKTLKKDVFLL